MERWLKLHKGVNLDEIFAFLGNGGGEQVMQASDRLARAMVTQTAVQNANSWREAARKSSQGKRIFDLLRMEMQGPVGLVMRGLVAHHAKLIRSIPQDLAQDVASQIATRQMRGQRAEVIAKDIRQRFPEITRSRIAMLARTGVSSTATAISESRAKHLSLPAYIWTTSQDSRVRPSHRIMSEVICLWDDPPAPEALAGIKSRLGRYNAGNCPNDRCDPSVIVDLDQVNWPSKMHYRGKIIRVTRAKFLKIAA
jgi:SPP1 gp7 family putative phage head morphogenesis protein